MAVTTKSNLANLLTTTYTRDNWWVPFEQNATKFLDQIEDFAQNDEPLGAQRNFRLWLADPQASGSVAEGGELPDPAQPDVEQASITAVQQASAFALSELMLAAAQGEGVLDTDIVASFVESCTRNLFNDINKATVAGHGTARLAVVESATDTSTTVPCRLPEHVFQVKRKMKVAFYDTDTSGSKQGATETVSTVDFANRRFTIGNQRTLTAGWGIYKATDDSSGDTYGIAPNGARGIADNGNLQASIYTLSRSSVDDINGNVISPGSGTQTYSQKLVRKGLHRLIHEVGVTDENMQIWTNTGVLSEHYNFTSPALRFNNPGSGAPSYDVGAEGEYPKFYYMGQAIPFKCDPYIPARELMILTMGLFRRHILRRASWVGDGVGEGGSASPVLMQLPGSSNYALSKIAGQLWIGNIAHLFPKATVRITQIADEELAGDTVDS